MTASKTSEVSDPVLSSRTSTCQRISSLSPLIGRTSSTTWPNCKQNNASSRHLRVTLMHRTIGLKLSDPEVNDDGITKQSLQWTPQGHRGRGRPRNTWRRDLEKEMWTAGYKYSWRKMEAATHDKTELDGDKWSVAYDVTLGVTIGISQVIQVSRVKTNAGELKMTIQCTILTLM